MYFCNFVIISPLKKEGTFISTNWNRCHLKMVCAKFGGNWLSCSGEDFLNSSMYLHFCNYLHLEKGRALHLNKFESPSFKDALCQVCLKLAQWFCRRRRKCEKFRTKTMTNNGQIVIFILFGSGELIKVHHCKSHVCMYFQCSYQPICEHITAIFVWLRIQDLITGL